MSRLIRNLTALLIGILFGGILVFSASAFATITPSIQYSDVGWNWCFGTTSCTPPATAPGLSYADATAGATNYGSSTYTSWCPYTIVQDTGSNWWKGQAGRTSDYAYLKCMNGGSLYTNKGMKVSLNACPSGYTSDTTTGQCKTTSAQCPANSTLNGSICTCNTGYSELNGACVQNNCSSAGTVFSSGYYDLGTSPDATPLTTACDSGCETSYSGTGVAFRNMVNGVYHYWSNGGYSYTGQVCTGGTTSSQASTSLPQTTCNPDTQWQGEVNNQTVCLPKTESQTTTTSTTTNPDGSTSKTTTTTLPDGTQSTTTENTSADGTTTTSSTTTTPSSDDIFCKQNPTDESCRKGDRWDGTGTKVGMGTTNNAALDQAKQDLRDLITRIKNEASSLVTGTANVTGDLPCNSIQVLGQDFSLCFSKYQTQLETIGAAFVVMALIAVAFMVLL